MFVHSPPKKNFTCLSLFGKSDDTWEFFKKLVGEISFIYIDK